MPVKLDPALEQSLRQRSAAFMHEALTAWLASAPEAAAPSAHALGADLFGRHRGPADLAAKRKQAVAEGPADKHAARLKSRPHACAPPKPRPATRPLATWRSTAAR